MASALLFTAVFIMIGGVQIISTRVLDGRRTLVIGMGLMAFVAVSVYPNAFTSAPAWAQPLVTSPLVLATLTALLLNLLFRLGIRRTMATTVDPAKRNVRDLTAFVERAGGAWGARRDIISKVEFALQQTAEAVLEFANTSRPIEVEISYDEFVIEARLAYVGLPLQFPTSAPSHDEIAESEEGAQRLAGFLIRRHADKIETGGRGGMNEVRLRFEH